MSPRPREKILTNLDTVFREAYQRAKGIDDKARMTELDASYQREQLILEVLLDIRDATPIHAQDVRNVAGRVRSVQDSVPLLGVTVQVVGTTMLASTDATGSIRPVRGLGWCRVLPEPPVESIVP